MFQLTQCFTSTISLNPENNFVRQVFLFLEYRLKITGLLSNWARTRIQIFWVQASMIVFHIPPHFLLNVLREKNLRCCRPRVTHTPTLYVTLAKVKERKSFLKARRWLQRKEKRNTMTCFIFCKYLSFAVFKSVRIMWLISLQSSHWDLWTQKK